MPVEPAYTYEQTTLGRKYQYAYNELIKTWSDVSFFLSNVQRLGGRIINGGRSTIIPIENKPNGSFRFMDVGEAPAESGAATFDEAVVDFTTWTVGCGYDWHAKVAGATNEQSFFQARAKAVADAAEVMGLRWSHALFMPQSNAVARLKTDLGGNKWQLYTESDTGNGGTFGAKYLFPGGYASASANTTGKVAELAFDGYSGTVDRVADQATFTGENLASLVADSYIFWGSKPRTSKGRGIKGLPELVDDGTNYSSTYEGRSRTTNPDWRAEVETSFGTGDIEQTLIRRAINLSKRRPGVRTDVVLYGLEAQFLHFRQMAADRQATVPVGNVNPTYVGGFRGLPVSYGEQTFIAMANSENPDSVIYGLNWASVALAMLRDPEWLDEGEGQFKLVQDTTYYSASLIAAGQLASQDPARNWAITGLTPNP